MASRLPGPTLEPDDTDLPHPGEAVHLIAGAQASLDLLSQAGQFSELGERIAQGLRSTLDDLEAALGCELRRELQARIHGLYVIIDPLVTRGRNPVDIARQALEGGARLLQLRDKKRDKGQSLPLSLTMRDLCLESDALFIVNDHADLASAVRAHGVHVGLTDLPIASARAALGIGQLVGRSNHTLDEALETQSQGADYVAVGAMYPTSSKDQPIVAGPELLRRIKASVKAPVVAIGGITSARVEAVIRAGADALCVISAVGLAANPTEATRELVDSIERAGGKA
jgi:thiamine-phosphate pyrophosphorylase